VIPGFNATSNAAHSQYAGVTYGTTIDFAADASLGPLIGQRAQTYQAQEVTITGATGTTAAIVTVPSPAFLNCTGTSGAGINLPVPVLGASYTIKNLTTGVCKIYSVGATINGTTGTTAVSLSATGDLGAYAFCSTAAAWQITFNT
jgi:hypothetical protein